MKRLVTFGLASFTWFCVVAAQAEPPPGGSSCGVTAKVALRVLHQDSGAPFALSTPGPYSIKVSCMDSFACTSGIEAPIIHLNVVAPTGDDLAVWTAIKDCSECAFILHTAEVRSTQADQDAVTLLRSLVKQYPKSHYAKVIRKQLDVLDGNDKKDRNRGKGKSHDD